MPRLIIILFIQMSIKGVEVWVVVWIKAWVKVDLVWMVAGMETLADRGTEDLIRDSLLGGPDHKAEVVDLDRT